MKEVYTFYNYSSRFTSKEAFFGQASIHLYIDDLEGSPVNIKKHTITLLLELTVRISKRID